VMLHASCTLGATQVSELESMRREEEARLKAAGKESEALKKEHFKRAQK
jgi:hypothetical protein